MYFRISLLLLIFSLLVSWQCGSKSNDDPAEKTAKEENSKKTEQPKSPPGPFAARALEAIPVEVTYVTQGDISSYLLYSAALETEQMVDVYSRIQGLVEKLFVDEGQFVKKDQPLLQLEQEEYQLEEQKARIQYETARNEYERFQALKEKNLLSQEEFETARLNFQQAELAWKQAQLNLDYTIVRSPISGVVAERNVRLGDRIQPTTKLFTITNLEEKIAQVWVPQDELPKCYLNQPAVLTSDVFPEQKFKGRVKRISPVIDAQSGTFKVTVEVIEPRNLLKPGIFLDVQLIVDTHKDVPLIPKTALIYENERSYFFVIENDTARKVELMKDFEDAEKVEIKNAIPVGTPVVVLGQSGLKDGAKVKITNVRRYSWQVNFPEPLVKKEAKMEDIPDSPSAP